MCPTGPSSCFPLSLNWVYRDGCMHETVMDLKLEKRTDTIDVLPQRLPYHNGHLQTILITADQTENWTPGFHLVAPCAVQLKSPLIC